MVKWRDYDAEMRQDEAALSYRDDQIAALEARVKELEAERDKLKADMKLRSKSYDANSKGWQEDIKKLKADVARLVEAVYVHLIMIKDSNIYKWESTEDIRKALAAFKEKEAEDD